jgi:type II secretory pathway pseudopilin PulG
VKYRYRQSSETRKLQAGYSLIEVLISSALLLGLMAMVTRLFNDYMLTAKTLESAVNANNEMVTLIRNIRNAFQSSVPVDTAGVRIGGERACVITGSGDAIEDYQCSPVSSGQQEVALNAAGIGFRNDADGRPTYAYVNACEPLASSGPSGSQTRTGPVSLTSIQNWGAAAQVCPLDCPNGQRPIVKLLKTGQTSDPPQVPKRIGTGGGVNLWGASLCVGYFRDEVRELQNLYGDNVGTFRPGYLNVSVFVARSKFDERPPAVVHSWVHGGIVLEMGSAQELNVYRCTPPSLSVPSSTQQFGCVDVGL